MNTDIQKYFDNLEFLKKFNEQIYCLSISYNQVFVLGSNSVAVLNLLSDINDL